MRTDVQWNVAPYSEEQGIGQPNYVYVFCLLQPMFYVIVTTLCVILSWLTIVHVQQQFTVKPLTAYNLHVAHRFVHCTQAAILELATNFWLLVLSVLHNYAWDL